MKNKAGGVDKNFDNSMGAHCSGQGRAGPRAEQARPRNVSLQNRVNLCFPYCVLRIFYFISVCYSEIR